MLFYSIANSFEAKSLKDIYIYIQENSTSVKYYYVSNNPLRDTNFGLALDFG